MKLEDFFLGASKGCAVPNCTHDHSEMYMHSGCHPGSPTWTVVEPKTRTIRIICATCEADVIKIECSFLN